MLISRLGRGILAKSAASLAPGSAGGLLGSVRVLRKFAGPPPQLGPNRYAKARTKSAEKVEEKNEVHLNFKAFQLEPTLEEYFAKKEITTPTPIQTMLIPKLLAEPSKSFYVGAQTGSGKTLAYLLPIFTLLKKEEKSLNMEKGTTLSMRPRVLVICPSKELVHQVFSVAKDISHFCKLRVAKLSGEQDFFREKEKLFEGCDIIVGTLRRIEQHINRRSLFTSQVQTIVVDEADTILDAGDEEALGYFMRIVVNQTVIDQRGTAARAVFVTATLGGTLKNFLAASFGSNNPDFELLMDKSTHLNLSNIKHEFIHLTEFDKHTAFSTVVKDVAHSLKKHKKTAIIFCETVKSAQSTEYLVKELGHDCVSLHGDVPARLRVQNYDRFQNKEVPFLIATDVASRGLDFRHVSHVINFDFPQNASDYLHRVGRTGRAGDRGTAISLYRNSNLPLVNKLRESYEQGIPLLLTTSNFNKINKEDLRNKNSKRERVSSAALARIEASQSSLQRARSVGTQELKPREDKSERIVNFKKPPEPREKKTYKRLRNEIKNMPGRVRQSSQKYVKNLQKRMRNLQKSMVDGVKKKSSK